MQILLTSIFAFISTNIDDIFILMLFYASGKYAGRTIIAGQYLGIGTLVVIASMGAYIGNFFDERYVGLLGLFPIYLAVRQVVDRSNTEEEIEPETELKANGILAIAGVTIANGGDNIGVYVPLLATMSFMDKIVLVAVFAIATLCWCLIAKYLSSHPVIAKQLERYGHIITPVVLFALGVFILIESRTYSLFGM